MSAGYEYADCMYQILYAQGQYDEAISYQKRALAIFEKQLGPDHPDLAITLGNIGEVCVWVQDVSMLTACTRY